MHHVRYKQVHIPVFMVLPGILHTPYRVPYLLPEEKSKYQPIYKSFVLNDDLPARCSIAMVVQSLRELPTTIILDLRLIS